MVEEARDLYHKKQFPAQATSSLASAISVSLPTHSDVLEPLSPSAHTSSASEKLLLDVDDAASTGDKLDASSDSSTNFTLNIDAPEFQPI